MISAVPFQSGIPEGPRVIVVALATTAIKPKDGVLLEVGAVALERAQQAAHTDSFWGLVQHDVEAILTQADAKVSTMHAENGLLDLLVEEKGSALETVDAAMAKWLDRIGACGESRSPLIAFHAEWVEEWLQAYLPKTLGRFMRDRIDVGSLLRCYDVPRKKADGRALHEAMAVASQYGNLFPGVSRLDDMRKAT